MDDGQIIERVRQKMGISEFILKTCVEKMSAGLDRDKPLTLFSLSDLEKSVFGSLFVSDLTGRRLGTSVSSARSLAKLASRLRSCLPKRVVVVSWVGTSRYLKLKSKFEVLKSHFHLINVTYLSQDR